MDKEKMERALYDLNNSEELKEKYRKAVTAEEKAAVFHLATGLDSGGKQELSEDDLDAVNGGIENHFRCMAVCKSCGWRSRIGSPNYVYDLGMEHIESGDCRIFNIVGL